ncbi:hypothetical protein T492DRAFT_896040 [Pavlovales sp. CCMP2436]|nr:hypothetical protein T492DRAFT_896040 [Pavlovales sp. CCMP2436]
MATIVNNEGRWMPEWVLFHRLLGFDHFYVYDDSSVDDTRDVVCAFGELGWATLHASVPSLQRDLNIRVPAHVHFTPQFVIVQHAARTYAHETEWLAFFDVDEFVLPKSAETWCVGAYLAGRPKGQGVLRLQGNLFLPNTTDHRKLPRSRLLIDTAKFLVPLGKNKERYRGPLRKNFARPVAIANIDHHNIHSMRPDPAHIVVLKDKNELSFAHFRYRTMADFEVKKHKTYAGHVGKARVFERLTAALNGYLKQGVEIHPSHPIHRYQPAVRGFYATFQAWYEHPPPRPQLAIPAAFGRAEIAERIPSSA